MYSFQRSSRAYTTESTERQIQLRYMVFDVWFYPSPLMSKAVDKLGHFLREEAYTNPTK